MKLEEYRNIYSKMQTDMEMDQRILENIKERKKGKWTKKYNGIIVAIATIALMIGVIQIPAVSSAAKKIMEKFTTQITLPGNIERENERVDATSDGVYTYISEYISIKENAPKKDCKMNSLSDAEDVLGISLLKSDAAKEDKYCTVYNAYVSKTGALNGVMIQNHFYAVGDLKNVNVQNSKDVETVNSIVYQAGEKYKSPIYMQITIRSDNDDAVDYENHELEYAGLSEDYSSADDGITDVELYELENLGVKTVISTVQADGMSSWCNETGEQISSVTDVLFVYKGIEYRYMGAVSHDTMKEFLDGLHEIV